MLTKGIVLNRIINTNKYNVRIPYLEAPGMGPSCFEAILSTVPGVSETLLPNDVVIVGFEDHHPSHPIIVGKLFLQEESEPRGSAIFDSLTVTGLTNLSQSTVVGGVNVYKTLMELLRRMDIVETAIENSNINHSQV